MAYYWLYNTSNDNIYILILIIVILALIIVNFKMWSKKTDRFNDVQTPMWINKKTGIPVTVTQDIYNATFGAANGEGVYTTTTNGEITTLDGITYTYVSPSPLFGLSNGINTNYNTVLDVNKLNNAGASPTDPNYTYIYVIQTQIPTTTYNSSNQPATTPNSTIQPTTTHKAVSGPGMWINLATGNPVTVTQQIYDKSIVDGLNANYNKINSGSITINGNTYSYISPSPFKYGSYNYNIIKDIDAFFIDQSANPNDLKYIYIYVSTHFTSNNPTTTLHHQSTSNNPATTLHHQSTTSNNPNTSHNPTLPLCIQPPIPSCAPQTTLYNLNANFYISPEEQSRRNAWVHLDGNEESLANTNGTPTYKNDITYSGSLLNNSNSNSAIQALNYSTIGDYATLDSLGAKLTDTLGGIKSNLGYTLLDEQLGTFNKYNQTPKLESIHTYDNTANYNTGMNPNTVNGVTPSSGSVSGQGSGISGNFTQDNRPFFMQKDFDGVSNIFAPNIIISNPPLTADGNPDITFEM